MKKMTRNEFLKMAGTSAALVVINTALVPTAIAAEPIGTVLSAKKSVNTGTAVSSATFELVPISRQTFWGDSGSWIASTSVFNHTISIIIPFVFL